MDYYPVGQSKDDMDSALIVYGDPFKESPADLFSTIDDDLTEEPTSSASWLSTCFLLNSLRRFGKLLPIIITLIIGVVSGYIFWCISTIPNIDLLKDYSPYKSSKIFSDDGQLLTELFVERRTLVPYDKIPPNVINAFIAVEDTRYYQHSGIDPIRIIGALYADIKDGSYLQGGSTITQQLTKMILLKSEKTITRKIKELILSLKVERIYTKNEILEMYLNKAYFGAKAYGINAAAQTYFGKTISNIDLPQAAMLAALLKAPSKYSPFKNPQQTLERRNHVLKRMLMTGFIEQTEYERAVKTKLPEKYHGRKYKAPYFINYCKNYLKTSYGERLYTSGLNIYTTLDYKMQESAKKAVQNGITRLKQQGANSQVQAALLAVDIKSGRIKAMVGGNNFWDSQFNRAIQAKRQPGSAFKPIVYLTALQQGISPLSLIEDKKITYDPDIPQKRWTPKNYNNQYNGFVPLEEALACSLNAATVNLSHQVGLNNIIKTARDLGIKSIIHPFYPSVLGASEVSLLEITYAYVAIAGGIQHSPVCISRIIDRDQTRLIEPAGESKKVLTESVRKNIRAMLRLVIEKGTGRRAMKIKRLIYGKTGTTNNYADALFLGFDDKTAVGVWVGLDSNLPIGHKMTGSSAALPIWIDFMESIS